MDDSHLNEEGGESKEEDKRRRARLEAPTRHRMGPVEKMYRNFW